MTANSGIRSLPVFCLLIFSGCAFLEERGRDFADCFQGSVGAGIGAETHVQIGPLAAGLGFYAGYGLKYDENGESGVRIECYCGMPFSFFAAPGTMAVFNAWRSEEDAFPGWCLLLGFASTGFRMSRRPGDDRISARFFPLTWQMNYFNDREDRKLPLKEYFWVRASLHCMVGFDAGFNLAEFADFLLGWLGIDLLGDDEGKEKAGPYAGKAEVKRVEYAKEGGVTFCEAEISYVNDTDFDFKYVTVHAEAKQPNGVTVDGRSFNFGLLDEDIPRGFEGVRKVRFKLFPGIEKVDVKAEIIGFAVK